MSEEIWMSNRSHLSHTHTQMCKHHEQQTSSSAWQHTDLRTQLGRWWPDVIKSQPVTGLPEQRSHHSSYTSEVAHLHHAERSLKCNIIERWLAFHAPWWITTATRCVRKNKTKMLLRKKYDTGMLKGVVYQRIRIICDYGPWPAQAFRGP